MDQLAAELALLNREVQSLRAVRPEASNAGPEAEVGPAVFKTY